MDSAWHELRGSELGFLATLSHCVAAAEGGHPGLVPDLHRYQQLFVASDYGGEHASVHWATYSFLVSSMEEVGSWVTQSRQIRARFLPDGRRISYKRLGDRIRGKALGPFLEIANSLTGLLVCFVVHRAIISLFGREKLEPANIQYAPLQSYPVHVAEKLLRVTHFLALLVAGVSAKGQDLLWVTDQDPVAPNDNSLTVLTDVFGRATASLLPHRMRNLRVATAKSDPGDCSIEDALAIPDLVAGVLPEALGLMLGERGAPPSGLFLPRLDIVPHKVRILLDWFSDNTQRLRRLVILIDQMEGRSLRATNLHFAGTRDLALDDLP